MSKNNTYSVYLKSPIGIIKIDSDDKFIIGANFVSKKVADSKNLPNCMQECLKQFEEYFAGKRTDFNLPLSPNGTDFQKSVWKQLQKISYGKTASYSDIATSLKKPDAQRAVGNANNKNPISIIVPCHRVVGKNGSLTGYAGGLNKKDWLLKHEQRAQQ